MNRKNFYNVQKISERAYRISSDEAVFSELLIGTEKAMLIDTTYGLGDLHGTVRQLTDKPLIIACTHGHADHTSGNSQFQEPVYLSEDDFDLCRRHNSVRQRQFTIKDMACKEDYMTHTVRNILPEDFDEEDYLAQNEGELVKLCEGMVFDLGGITLTAPDD